MVEFNILDVRAKFPSGYQYIKYHTILDIKKEYFRRKGRLFAGGHVKYVLPTITYVIVVSCETVRVSLTIDALDDLQVKLLDIMDAYVTALVQEKIWTILGPEFGKYQGKKALIVRALYGLKRAETSLPNHLAYCMNHLSFPKGGSCWKSSQYTSPSQS